MSKQYLTSASHDQAHPSSVFALASTPDSLLSASGSSSLQIHSTTTSAFPHSQTLSNVHKLGAHHLAASADGTRAVSVGFAGEVLIWQNTPAAPSPDGSPGTSSWSLLSPLTVGLTLPNGSFKPGECWAVALSADGTVLAGTTMTGHLNIWHLGESPDGWTLAAKHETKGSFGMSVAVSADGALAASGHANGGIFVFNVATGRLVHVLFGMGARSVRAVKFSPAGRLLAAGGDARVVALYDAVHGEQVAALRGHAGWITALDWSGDDGEYVVSADYAGKIRVWRTETGECVSVLAVEEEQGAIWSLAWLRGVGRGTARRSAGFVVGTEAGGLRFLREAAGS